MKEAQKDEPGPKLKKNQAKPKVTDAREPWRNKKPRKLEAQAKKHPKDKKSLRFSKF